MSYGDSPGNPVLKTLHWACVQSLVGELRSHIAVAEKKKQLFFKITIKRFVPGTTCIISYFPVVKLKTVEKKNRLRLNFLCQSISKILMCNTDKIIANIFCIFFFFC